MIENTLTEKDKSLIGYAELHSKTDLALFDINRVNRLLELADMDLEDICSEPFAEFISIPYFGGGNCIKGYWKGMKNILDKINTKYNL